MGHHVDFGRWDNHSCELLYSIKLLYFGESISECLWSPLIDAGSQAMCILQSFDKDSNGSGIICKMNLLASV